MYNLYLSRRKEKSFQVIWRTIAGLYCYAVEVKQPNTEWQHVWSTPENLDEAIGVAKFIEDMEWVSQAIITTSSTQTEEEADDDNN